MPEGCWAKSWGTITWSSSSIQLRLPFKFYSHRVVMALRVVRLPHALDVLGLDPAPTMGQISRGGPSWLFLKVGSCWDLPSRKLGWKSPKKSGKVGIYPDSPRLWAQKMGYITTYLEILKSWDGHPDPALPKSPDPRPVPTQFCRDFIPLEIS